jgi:hypothetical protein
MQGVVAGSITGAEGFGVIGFRVAPSASCTESSFIPNAALSIEGPTDFLSVLELSGPGPSERCVRAVVFKTLEERVDSAQGTLWFGLQPSDTLRLDLERPVR